MHGYNPLHRPEQKDPVTGVVFPPGSSAGISDFNLHSASRTGVLCSDTKGGNDECRGYINNCNHVTSLVLLACG
jgi:hypothetical protein